MLRILAPILVSAATLNAGAFERVHAADAPLAFRVTEGRVLNAFYQHDQVAAHLLLTSGTQPRVLVAFPAGNSGVGLWLEPSSSPVRWTLGDIEGISRRDVRGRMLHGIVADASIDAPLVVRDAVLSSVRVLRDYQISGTYPAEVKSVAKITSNSVEWARDRLDGAAGYALSITVENGIIRGGQSAPITFTPSRAGEPMRLRVTALSGETPLTPLGTQHLLNANATADVRSRQVLGFLSYQEKFLAGSWRFNTYFGRDTLMSLRLLLPALQPEALERGIAAVLQRLKANGEVAHEEDIGEFAVLRHRKEGDALNDAPIYDYNMIDDDFMLAPLVAAYLNEHPQGRARAKDFLGTATPSGERIGAALARNFVWVAQSARAFAQTPEPRNLIVLKAGLNAGQWRDSQDGLAGGRYPFDVNAVFVPAAMSAIAQFVRDGTLDPYLSPERRKILEDADRVARIWSSRAPAFFRIRIASADAHRHITAYAENLGVSAAPALQSLPKGDVVMDSIALDANLRPIPVLHSDSGFALLLQNLSAAEVEQYTDQMLRPFPAGLLTEAGLLVANPVFADVSTQRKFGRTAYHGTVVWSWQQALLAAGIERQISRRDLPAETVKRLQAAQERLWSVIDNTRDLRASELWSWQYSNGRFQPAPFGQNSGDADESNAAQLWSTVYLSIARP